MKDTNRSRLLCAFACASLLNASAQQTDPNAVFYHGSKSTQPTQKALPLTPEYPCILTAVNGEVSLDGRPIYRGDQLESLNGLQFAQTNQVVVITDRYQRNFYVTPRTRHFNDLGLPCSSPNMDCTPIVRDNMGAIVFVAPQAPRYEPAAYAYTVTSKGETPVEIPALTPLVYDLPTPVRASREPAVFEETATEAPARTVNPMREQASVEKTAAYRLLVPQGGTAKK